MKLCVECKHCGPIEFGNTGTDLTRCLREGRTKAGISQVTGEPYREQIDIWAGLERERVDRAEACGPQGRFWQAKDSDGNRA